MFLTNRAILGFLVPTEIHFAHCRRNERMHETRLMNATLSRFTDIFRVPNFIPFSI